MSYFDDDPELLRAALDIIESWEGDASTADVLVQSPGATDHSESGAASPNDAGSADGSDDSYAAVEPPTQSRGRARLPKNELKPSTIASTRHRRREEIIYLRDKVKELEAQLTTLQKSETHGANSSDVEQAMTHMWKDIAHRQQRLRQRSELEKAKLRSQLETQMKVAQGLVKVLQKAKRTEEYSESSKPKKSRYAIDTGDDWASGELLSRVEQLYVQRESVFVHPKFLDGTLKFLEINVHEHFENQKVVELQEAWTIPFQWSDVLDAVWTYLVRKNEGKMAKPGYEATISRADDSLTFNFTVKASTYEQPLSGSFQGSMISKRFRSDDAASAALLSSMQVVTSAADGESHSGPITYGDTWMQARPVVLSDRAGSLTTMQVVERFVVTFDPDPAMSGRQLAAMVTDFLLDHVKQDVELRHEVVESLLLGTRVAQNTVPCC